MDVERGDLLCHSICSSSLNSDSLLWSHELHLTSEAMVCLNVQCQGQWHYGKELNEQKASFSFFSSAFIIAHSAQRHRTVQNIPLCVFHFWKFPGIFFASLSLAFIHQNDDSRLAFQTWKDLGLIIPLWLGDRSLSGD